MTGTVQPSQKLKSHRSSPRLPMKNVKWLGHFLVSRPQLCVQGGCTLYWRWDGHGAYQPLCEGGSTDGMASLLASLKPESNVCHFCFLESSTTLLTTISALQVFDIHDWGEPIHVNLLNHFPQLLRQRFHIQLPSTRLPQFRPGDRFQRGRHEI